MAALDCTRVCAGLTILANRDDSSRLGTCRPRNCELWHLRDRRRQGRHHAEFLSVPLGFGDNPPSQIRLRCGETVPLARLVEFTRVRLSDTRHHVTGPPARSRWMV